MEGTGEMTGEKTRIYVGGLGGGVTEDDLRKTFSALGEVVAVDVVRTKGRSFAYLDFLPSSDKSLPKLFSRYNGCMWKGGKLRLEKAKEHYLLRLRREWQEESTNSSKASHGSDTDPSESHDTLEKPKRFSPSDNAQAAQLRIFFPKLGKVKSLAQVGIGKHKYSFQRIPVPSMPTHFCDCEEHSHAVIPTKKKQSSEIENASDGINEQELEIMNSVMNKIFEKANPCKQGTSKSVLLNETGVAMNSVDELAAVEDDEEDHLTDEDNLIINVVTGSDSMDVLGEMKTMMAKQESLPKRLITSNERPKSLDDSQKKKAIPLGKKRKSLHTEENDCKGPIIPETSRNSNICLDSREANKTEVESGSKQSGSNSLRSLKSTWKDLIGQKSNTQFSISDIIASVPQEQEKGNLDRSKKRKSEGDKGKNNLAHVNKEPTTEVENDSQKKVEEPGADLDVFLATTSKKTSESDVLPGASEQKEEPRTDDLVTSNVENEDYNELGNFKDSEKHDEDLIRTARGESDVLPGGSEQKEEPRIDDLVTSNVENEDNNELGNFKDGEKHDEDLIRTARGESWRHKSSWTQLISNASHTSFSISQIIPNVSFEKHEQQAEDTFDSQPEIKNLETCDAAPINNRIPAGSTDATVKKKKDSEPKKSFSLKSLESDETCLFMRTEESMKEWKKAKASLSGSLNKKKRSVKETA